MGTRKMNKPFLQSLNEDTYDVLLEEARKRNMTIQRLIEGVVILDWLKKQGIELRKK